MKASSFRRLLAAAAAAVLLAGWLPPAAAETFPFSGYTAETVRLRKSASTTSDILRLIPAQEAVLVTGAEGDFYIVQYEGASGYAMRAYITSQQPQGTALPTAKPASSAALQNYRQLKTGDEGAYVKALQQALQELRFLIGKTDGKYGDATAKAVREFQAKNKLPQNGVADPAMQQLLYEGKPLNALGKAMSVKTLPPIPGLTLRPGDQGDAVVTLQQYLAAQGYYQGKQDGKYGAGTQAAVLAFQKKAGLKADGIAGDKTLQKLHAAQGPAASAAPGLTPAPDATAPASAVFSAAPTSSAATYPYYTLALASVNMRKGMSLRAQRILTIPQGQTLKVLAQEGDYLKVEYKKYTGYVQANYIEIPEQYLRGKSLPQDTQARVKYETLTSGSEGYKVRTLQQALQELGFLSSLPDSKYGTATLTAMKAFQRANDLRETGIALPELQQFLYEQRIRNAKGRRVWLATLPPISGYPMQQGDRGDAVEQLHRQLTALGHYKGEISAEYTRNTAQAVRAFQKAHSIKETGKVDNFTWIALGAAAATPQPGGPVATPVIPPLTEENVVVLRNGTRGQAVTNLQNRLVALGYYQIAADGIYNAKDLAAVRAFQKNNGLTVTGIADLAMQQALYSPYAVGVGGATPQIVTSPAPQLPQTLKPGVVGDAVRALQTRLIFLKYLTGQADGIYGDNTSKAVAAFQRANQLKMDGIAGEATLSAVYAATANQVPTSLPSNAPGTSLLKIGATGSEVSRLQQRLIALKYLAAPSDGMFGDKTFLALKAFQSNNQLGADGIAGEKTLVKLFSANAVSASGLNPVLPPLPTVTPSPTPTSNNPGVPGVVSAPSAASVRFADWFGEVRSRLKSMPNVVIYDYLSGKSYNVKIFSTGRHADGEPVTKEDTAIMNAALGANNWTPHPVWVIFSDGRVYMASTHSHGHEVDHIAGNDITGHICVHFPRSMEDAQATGPYAVAHQQAILAGWDLTRSMAK